MGFITVGTVHRFPFSVAILGVFKISPKINEVELISDTKS